MILDHGLNFAAASAANGADGYALLSEDLLDASEPSPGPAATSGRIQEQRNRCVGHIEAAATGCPMLQWLRLRGKMDRLMLELGVKFLISYFIGSLMGAIIIGKLRGGVDIRTLGSGNAGGTNALRTQGVSFALGVVVIDIGKGAVAAGVIPGLEIPFVPMEVEVSRTWLVLCCSAAAVFGHVWPIYHHFRGGKGAATFVGTLLVINATLIIPLLVVWAAVLILSGYVGLATMTAAVVLPFWVAVQQFPAEQPLLIYCAVIAGFIVYWHRSNISRMRAGTEQQNTGLMIFKRKR
ncbi:MAG: glycerol-3-phosphate 1-O-acyltransferase PlsY [Gammaproteobacteria bacterium]|nr:glycerol-3-phosphate 1-O-acyltransferase PlsY [Gammaproteobacteria bacterium]MDH5305101.1 glycerol-3-phosphate 1-O-acyltransferase PlsY [Gammaproteobacteria bacterium]MDH5321768.1 glycerol-3-phosphate 1-O-acyltransferase PlsY [Gammaproteobacteria bacterium]